MAERLAAVLRDASTSPSRAIEAVKHLLTLQADGARCVADCDPLGLYLDAQARHFTGSIPKSLGNVQVDALHARCMADCDPLGLHVDAQATSQ